MLKEEIGDSPADLRIPEDTPRGDSWYEVVSSFRLLVEIPEGIYTGTLLFLKMRFLVW
jgi:hypothetical protein